MVVPAQALRVHAVQDRRIIDDEEDEVIVRVPAGKLRCRTTIDATGARITNLMYDPATREVTITAQLPDGGIEVFKMKHEDKLEIRSR